MEEEEVRNRGRGWGRNEGRGGEEQRKKVGEEQRKRRGGTEEEGGGGTEEEEGRNRGRGEEEQRKRRGGTEEEEGEEQRKRVGEEWRKRRGGTEEEGGGGMEEEEGGTEEEGGGGTEEEMHQGNQRSSQKRRKIRKGYLETQKEEHTAETPYNIDIGDRRALLQDELAVFEGAQPLPGKCKKQRRTFSQDLGFRSLRHKCI
ncbi:hypothetical protein STEG23_001561 [Scotinomys teguina]